MGQRPPWKRETTINLSVSIDERKLAAAQGAGLWQLIWTSLSQVRLEIRR